VQLADDRLWGLAREEQADPIVGLESGKPLFLRSRHIRQYRRSVARQDSERFDGPGFDLRQRGGNGVARFRRARVCIW
jgi:hypothetical protein